MERLLNDDIVGQIKEAFKGLQHPVQVLFFGSKNNCDYCDDTRQLIEEVVAISDLLDMSVYDMDADADVVKNFNVTMAPGIVIAAKEGEQITDFGVRLAGIPSGHEFSSLIQDLLLVSSRDSGLNPQTREMLKALTKPVHLQVFVTPT